MSLRTSSQNRIFFRLIYFLPWLFTAQLFFNSSFENIVASAFCCLVYAVLTRYFFWENARGSVYSEYPVSSLVLLNLNFGLTIGPFFLSTLFFKPVVINLNYPIESFSWALLICFLSVLSHYLYRKVSFFNQSFFLRKVFFKFNLYENKVFDLSIISLISISMLFFFNDPSSSIEKKTLMSPYIGLLFPLSGIVAAIPFNFKKNEQRLNRVLGYSSFFLVFFLLLLYVLIFSRRVPIFFFLFSFVFYFFHSKNSFNLKSLLIFLKKNPLLGFFLLGSFVFSVSIFYGALKLASLTRHEFKGLSPSEKIKESIKSFKNLEDYELNRDAQNEGKIYLFQDDATIGRLLTINRVDDFLLYYKNIPTSLEDDVLAKARNCTLRSLIPVIFFSNREAKGDCRSLYGTVGDLFFASATGGGLSAFRFTPYWFQEVIIFGFLYILVWVLLQIFSFSFLDAFYLREKDRSVIFSPFLVSGFLFSFFSFYVHLERIRDFFITIPVYFLLYVLFMKIIRFFRIHQTR